MGDKLIEACINPTRQRILQHLAFHGGGTAGELAAALGDVPRASLYRHLKVLTEAGAIEVTAEKAVRGAVERTYALTVHRENPSNQEIGALFQTALASLMTTFAGYFARPDADPVRDMLSVSASTLLMTDEEYAAFLQAVSALAMARMGNRPGDGRKPRSITLVCAPAEGGAR